MKQERPGMMHLKKVTKTVDCYSCGLSGDARSRRAGRFRLSAAHAPERGGSGACSPREPGAPARATARGGARTPSHSVPRGWRGQPKGGGRGVGRRAEGAGEGHLQPRSARARAPRAARSPPGAALGLSGGKVSEGRPRAAAETPAHSHWWAGAPASDPPRPPGSPPETEGAGGAGGPRARREGVGALRAVSWDRSGQRAAGRAPAPFPRFPRVCVGSAAASGS